MDRFTPPIQRIDGNCCNFSSPEFVRMSDRLQGERRMDRWINWTITRRTRLKIRPESGGNKCNGIFDCLMVLNVPCALSVSIYHATHRYHHSAKENAAAVRGKPVSLKFTVIFASGAKFVRLITRLPVDDGGSKSFGIRRPTIQGPIRSSSFNPHPPMNYSETNSEAFEFPSPANLPLWKFHHFPIASRWMMRFKWLISLVHHSFCPSFQVKWGSH